VNLVTSDVNAFLEKAQPVFLEVEYYCSRRAPFTTTQGRQSQRRARRRILRSRQLRTRYKVLQHQERAHLAKYIFIYVGYRFTRLGR